MLKGETIGLQIVEVHLCFLWADIDIAEHVNMYPVGISVEPVLHIIYSCAASSCRDYGRLIPTDKRTSPTITSQCK